MNDADKAYLGALEAAVKVLAREVTAQEDLARIGGDSLGQHAETIRVYKRASHFLHEQISSRYERDSFLRKKYGD